MTHRWIFERHTLKLLMEPHGAVLAFTMKRVSLLLFVSRQFVGWKRVRTKDRVVARAGYSTRETLRLIAELYPDGDPTLSPL